MSDQNTILSCKYNYVGGQGGRVDERGKGAAREGRGRESVWEGGGVGTVAFFLIASRLSLNEELSFATC